jgi:hypothetical protein
LALEKLPEEHDMKAHARSVAAILAVALGTWLAGRACSAPDDKDLACTVQRIAASYAKNDAADAQKQAAALAGKVDEIEDVMHLMTYRRSKGIGVGSKPGAIHPDGIEAKIIDLSKKALPQKQLDAEADALVTLGYIAASVGEVAHAKPPDKDEGKKKKSDWMKWSGEMRDAALQFAAAVKEKKPMDVQKAATKLYGSCTTCHTVFKDE